QNQKPKPIDQTSWLPPKDLYDQRNSALLYHIEAITGVWIRGLQGMPHHMCPQCQETLQKAIEFRENCMTTEFKLTQEAQNTDIETEEMETELENVLYEQSTEQNEGFSESELLSDIEYPLSYQKELCGPAGDGPCPTEPTVELQTVVSSDAFSVLYRPIEQKIQTPRPKRSKLTNEEKNLRRREQLRSKPLSYVFEQCGHAFRIAGHLQMHMLRHSGVKKFECPKCFKKFYNSYLRDSHLRVRHNGELTHIADIRRKIKIEGIVVFVESVMARLTTFKSLSLIFKKVICGAHHS
ncbi:zinc finger protein 131-like, partial [Drosophila persimilis]|uniref:zinc finger protein 131-like n=1 Tax=Drosophila persimilis TaxID=7234 RepID=UPI000F0754B7